MVHLFIGLIVGMVMGLTGAGGALISIPLFLHLLDATLKDATTLSLIAVIFGTGINLLGNFHKVDKKVVSFFAASGTMANILSLKIKGPLPDISIAVLLFLIGSLSIWSVWQKKPDLDGDSEAAGFLKIQLTGMLLGFITTLTGLGGGVILVPILMKFYGKSYSAALPTSLATIFLISLSSLFLQGTHALNLISLSELSSIASGGCLSFLILRASLKSIGTMKLEYVRKILFSFVVTYSLFSVLLKVTPD